MTDRVLRDELFDSDRFIDLPNDTCRLVYIGLLGKADDFGNFEAGTGSLRRFLCAFSDLDSDDGVTMTLALLVKADLLRKYDADERSFYHIPRSYPHRQYLVRKCPPSPWDLEGDLGKKRRVMERGLVKNQSLTKKIVDTSLPRSNHVAEGVGVGVGEKLLSQKVSVDNSTETSPTPKSQLPKASERSLKVKNGKATPLPPPPMPGESAEPYRLRCSMTRPKEPPDDQPHPLTPSAPFVRSEMPTSIRDILANFPKR